MGNRKLAQNEAKEFYTDRVFETKNFGKLLVISYEDSHNVEVEFLDTGYRTRSSTKAILSGSIKDKLSPTVSGVGYVGDTHTRENGKPLREYNIWCNMLRRCYNARQQVKQPTYVGCTVADEFKSFEFFSAWCKNQVGFENDDWVLDKDLLIKGNKVYSKDTCVFVPEEINGALIKNDKMRGDLPVGVKPRKCGTYQVAVSMGGYIEHVGVFDDVESAFFGYKKSKESYLRGLATYWKDKLDVRAYNALMNYQIEITD